MAPMRDRIAQALIEQIGSPWKWEDMPDAIKELWRHYAAATLKAMKDPPTKYIEAGTKSTDGYLNIEGSGLTVKHEKMRLRFNRIIDEMLKDKA